MINVATRALKLELRALIPYYENKEMNQNEKMIWEWKYSFCFLILTKVEDWIYTNTHCEYT